MIVFFSLLYHVHWGFLQFAHLLLIGSAFCKSKNVLFLQGLQPLPRAFSREMSSFAWSNSLKDLTQGFESSYAFL